MAIAQHQFYLDRKTSRIRDGTNGGTQLGIPPSLTPLTPLAPSLTANGLTPLTSSLTPHQKAPLPDVVGELSRSCLSLSTHSSSPNLSRSESHSSLQHNSHTEESASTESLQAARQEMVTALQQRYDSLQQRLDQKSDELRLLCLREGELTGELPPEYPPKAGQPPPVVRKRIGTSFMLDEALVSKIITKQEETVASLELEHEIQTKIVTAALRLANETSLRKGPRRQRKLSYQQATQRLRDIELRLSSARARQNATSTAANAMPKVKKKPRPISSENEGVDEHSFSSNIIMRETSFVDGSAPASHPRVGQSAPPSPQRSGLTTSEVSSSASSGVGLPIATKPSRSISPARPNSGYIPSVVYTRSEYRAQHFPTLSTRPADASPVRPGAGVGGLYNLPQQRTSLASNSLDRLDRSYMSPSVPNTTASTAETGVPPAPPHHHHFKHHQQQPHRTHHRNPSPQDRFGSLDRRHASAGRLESRSMEHLDTLPAPTPSAQHNGLPDPDSVDAPLTPLTSHLPPPGVDLARTLARSCSGRGVPHLDHSFTPAYNQENIPPQIDEILPLRATPQSCPRGFVKREAAPNLRSSASVAADLPLRPLRPSSRSSSEMPPVAFRGFDTDDEPMLLSLAEGARQRREERDRENRPADVSVSSITSSESSVVFATSADSSGECSTPNGSLSATLTVISTGSFQPSREITKPFEMADFYKYSTKFRRQSASSSVGAVDESSSGPVSPLSPSLPPRSSQLVMNVTVNSMPTPRTPQSPCPLQKGIYQPLTPLTCKPMKDGVSDSLNGTAEDLPRLADSRRRAAWEGGALHQAVPVSVTNKRSATLV